MTLLGLFENLYQCHDPQAQVGLGNLYQSGASSQTGQLPCTNMATKRPRDWDEASAVQDAMALGVCVTCGQRAPAVGHASCCRGCAELGLDGCDCDAPPMDAPTFLLCSACHVRTANVDDGFDTCCQGCIHGMCACDRLVPRGSRGIQLGDMGDYDQMSVTFPGPQPIGMTASEIAALPSWPAKDDSVSCPICMEPVTTGELTLNLPCLHGFHEQCVLPWLLRNASCPICKTATK